MRPDTRPIEVLLVEDNPVDAMVTREALIDGKICNRLHIVEDGVQALDFLYRRGKYEKAPRPDLILLDLNLPRKDGREVLLEIKNNAELKFIPVVVLTTSESDSDILRSYELHANCFVTKPVELERFAQVVRSIEGFWFSIVKLPPE